MRDVWTWLPAALVGLVLLAQVVSVARGWSRRPRTRTSDVLTTVGVALGLVSVLPFAFGLPAGRGLIAASLGVIVLGSLLERRSAGREGG